MQRDKMSVIKLLLLLLLLLVVVVVGVWFFARTAEAPSEHDQEQSSEQVSETQPSEAFNMQLHSLDDPTSPWVVANKLRPLNPLTYYPSDLTTPNIPLRSGGEEMLLRQEVATALENMFADAKQAGLQLMLASGFRSYNSQRAIYDRHVRNLGQEEADIQSARPGYSEHQTGLAADVEPASRICEIEECFADTPEGQWVAQHAHKHGFIIRYPRGKTAVTGYIYEPWHLRYVGTELSSEMHTRGIQTLEEFFSLPDAPRY